MIEEKTRTNITIAQIRQNIRNRVYPSVVDATPRFRNDCLEALGLSRKRNANAVFRTALKLSVSERPMEVLQIMIDLATLLWTVGPTFND